MVRHWFAKGEMVPICNFSLYIYYGNNVCMNKAWSMFIEGQLDRKSTWKSALRRKTMFYCVLKGECGHVLTHKKWLNVCQGF